MFKVSCGERLQLFNSWIGKSQQGTQQQFLQAHFNSVDVPVWEEYTNKSE